MLARRGSPEVVVAVAWVILGRQALVHQAHASLAALVVVVT
jgi:hypothetical protein